MGNRAIHLIIVLGRAEGHSLDDASYTLSHSTCFLVLVRQMFLENTVQPCEGVGIDGAECGDDKGQAVISMFLVFLISVRFPINVTSIRKRLSVE